jgi:hypothetical protein
MGKARTIGMALAAGGALSLASCNLEEFVEGRDGPPGTSLEEKVVLGLRKALEVGIDSSASAASRLNGYLAHKTIKILLPEEAEEALAAAEEVAALVKPFSAELEAMQTLVTLTPGVSSSSFTSSLGRSASLLDDIEGLENIGDSVVKYMNRAAEYAAPRSVPIFKDAIAGFTVDDGLALLNSSDSTAATDYLDGKTFDPLATAYTPVVNSTLALVPLTRYWDDFRTLYNSVLSNYAALVAFQESWNANAVVASVPALQVDVLAKTDNKPIETESLGAYTTGKALEGLFFLVGEEEKAIRRDPFAYVQDLAGDLSDLLEEVFGEIMDMEG